MKIEWRCFFCRLEVKAVKKDAVKEKGSPFGLHPLNQNTHHFIRECIHGYLFDNTGVIMHN